MFSKHTFLGVATATSAKAVAGVATSTKMTGAVKKFTAFTAVALMGFGFMGCDDVKSLVASVSIEQPVVSIESEYYEGYNAYFQKVGDIRKFVKIQSKDEKTIINGINANRGNCATLKYRLDNKKLQAYANANPDKVILGKGFLSSDTTQLQTTSGELVAPKDGIYSDDLSFYESLNEQSKAVYNSLFPVTMPFGKTEKYLQGFFKCKIDTIIELELIVNDGGSISYSFDQTM